MAHSIPTEHLKRDLDLAAAVGAVKSYAIVPSGRRGNGRRRFLVTLPDDSVLDRGPIWVEAFGLAVRIMVEQRDGGEGMVART